jgi:transcriptional regulator with XRE-family HTH domain
MDGQEIRRLREALGLEAFAFATSLGVHPSTLYRWEQAKGQVKMDPLQSQILERLAATLAKDQAKRAKEAGEAILAGLLAGGALLGLAALLDYLTKKKA